MRLFRIELPIWLVVPLLGIMLLLGAGGGFAAGWIVHPTTNCPESPEVCEEFGAFWEVWQLASENFVDAEAVQPDRMTEWAINGMLDSLGDQGHTRYLSAEAAHRWDESLSGEFEGIGAYLDMRDDVPIIVAPIEGSPAEAAGLRENDIILKVDGQDTLGWTIEEVVAAIRGPRGSTVVLTVQHIDEEIPVEISVKRDTIEVPNVTWRMLPGDIALIQLTSFSQRSAAEMTQALTEAKDEGARAVILDIRNNLGGYVHEAIGIASQFLPEGTTVLLEQDRSGTREPSKTIGGGVALDMPMVVLINQNTASSAEILSGALQDEARAELVGVRTVGTGTVLSTYNLEDGAKLLLGTMQWLTPDGREIRRQGIEPDIEVMLPFDVVPLSPREAGQLSAEELHESEDVQLSRAYEVIQEALAQGDNE